METHSRTRGKALSTILLTALLGVSTAGCSVSTAVRTLEEYCPAPDLGRPAWVRASAGFGGWIVGGVGAVAAVVLLPVTYPVSLLADEPLGYSQGEFRFLPITTFAAAGHFVFGAPPDLFHFLFYRAWVKEDETPGYDFKPMPAPRMRDDAPAEPVDAKKKGDAGK